MPSISDELSEKVIGLLIKGVEVTPKSLMNAMNAYLEIQKFLERNGMGAKRVPITELSGYGTLANIEISDENIRGFESIARKYGIKYSLKRNMAAKVPTYYVFFLAKDTDTMTCAYKEFIYQQMNSSENKKESIKEKIKKFEEQVKSRSEKEKARKRTKKEKSL